MFREYFSNLKFRDYDQLNDRISEENRNGIGMILVFFSVILALNIFWMLIARQSILKNPSIMLEILYVLIAVPSYFILLRKKNINFTAAIYWFEIPMLLIAILHGTLLDPHNLTFTFFFFLLVLPQLILDKPHRIAAMIFALSAVYLLLDYHYTDAEFFPRDAMHAFNAVLMSSAATLYTLAARIQNIESASYFAEKADTDPLTGLYNRFGAERHSVINQPGLMIYMDLDQFKEVNDEFGHAEGDHVLRETADVLRSCFRKNDTLVRMGGDEFAVFAPGVWKESEIRNKLSEILQKVQSIHSYSDSKDRAMTVSIGCAYAPDGFTDINDMISNADREMYQIKRNGKDDFRIVKVEKKLPEKKL